MICHEILNLWDYEIDTRETPTIINKNIEPTKGSKMKDNFSKSAPPSPSTDNPDRRVTLYFSEKHADRHGYSIYEIPDENGGTKEVGVTLLAPTNRKYANPDEVVVFEGPNSQIKYLRGVESEYSKLPNVSIGIPLVRPYFGDKK